MLESVADGKFKSKSIHTACMEATTNAHIWLKICSIQNGAIAFENESAGQSDGHFNGYINHSLIDDSFDLAS